MNSEQIRKNWKNFWEDKTREHKQLSPAPLIPQWDNTSLFTVAWMQQLVPYLSGKSHPNWKRLYNIQKCIRTPDIEEIGDERHLTMFEMMWNWSLGDYFKKESLTWSVEFLTKVCKIPLEKIGATIFAWNKELGLGEDIEARKILNNLGIPDERIRAMKENWWWPAGEVWPCWPDCEFYIDRGDEFWKSDWLMDDNDRYTEIWNNVFMEFYKNSNQTFTKLPQNNVDTWMGLERLTMILQNKNTIFETDLFKGIINIIEKYTNNKYPPYFKKENNLTMKEKEITRRFRIITDHIRWSLFLIADWVFPSNEARGYVLRRLIRRAFYQMYLLNKEIDYEKSIVDIHQAVLDKYWDFRPNLQKDNTDIIINEIKKFKNTISKWLKLLNEIIKTIKDTNWNIIDGEIIFKLYDTFGFPFELTKEIAESENLNIDIKWFKKHMDKARQMSKIDAKNTFKRWIDWAKYLENIPPTEFIWYNKLETEDSKLLKKIEIDGKQIYIFDKTPFYAEWGWQTWDKWEIILNDGTILKVKDVKKIAGVYLHFIE